MTELYKKSVEYFDSSKNGTIDDDYVRERADHLIYCYQNKKDLLDFDFWTRYEDLLGEKISYDEYIAIDSQYDGSPFDVEPENEDKVKVFSYLLKQYRIKEASSALTGVESPYKSYGEMGLDLPQNYFDIDVNTLRSIMIFDDSSMEGVYINSKDNKFYFICDNKVEQVVPVRVVLSYDENYVENGVIKDFGCHVCGETDDLQYYVWFDELEPVKEYVLTLCEGEPEEEVIRAFLTDTEVNMINKDLAGVIGYEFTITTVDNKVVEIGIVDRIEPVGETKDIDKTDFTFVASKSVEDSDGFMTDYTWYKASDGTNVFVFGDNDVYKPEDGYFDHICEDEQEAREWFDSYNGFLDVDKPSLSDQISEARKLEKPSVEILDTKEVEL